LSAPSFAIAVLLSTAAANTGGDPAGLPGAKAMPVALASAPAGDKTRDTTDSSVDAGAVLVDKTPAGEPVSPEIGGKAGDKEIVVKARAGPPRGDPLQNVNVQTFEVVQAVDKAIIAPVTHGYMKAVPKPLRDGIHNVVTNLDEPLVALNFLLQLKPIQALKTLGRFVVNSTIGLLGLFDIAKKKPFKRPHINNNLGHTLAYYGVGPGPFLFLPVVGSTTLRDFVGQLAQMPLLPLGVGKPFNDPVFVSSKFLVTAVDERAQDDARFRKIQAESSNPYSDYRSYYLRKRAAELDVIKGLRKDSEVPVFDDEPIDDEEETPQDESGAESGGGEAWAAANVRLPIDATVVFAE